jgi:saccharopine dehydrogenase-like NADP-dependent oxidoreductase
LKSIMRRSVPSTAQDVVLVFITVTGMRDGQLVQEVFTRKIFAKTVCGVPMSAIQITTAGAMCAVLDLFRESEAAAKRFRASGAGVAARLSGEPLRSTV